MSSPSEEIWESFDVLWRRFEQLSRKVRELEARLGAIETEPSPEMIVGENERFTKARSADERSS